MIIWYRMSMNHEQRSGFKWTINETLQVQREYELLNMDIEEIALKHERTVNGIIQKIEEILNDSDEDMEEEEEEEQEDDKDYTVFVDDSSVLCIAEKKEPIAEGSPQKTIHAYEYFKRSVFGWFSGEKI